MVIELQNLRDEGAITVVEANEGKSQVGVEHSSGNFVEQGHKTRLIVDNPPEINFCDVSSKEKESLNELMRQSNELLESTAAGEIAIQLSECVEHDVQQAFLQPTHEVDNLEEELPE